MASAEAVRRSPRTAGPPAEPGGVRLYGPIWAGGRSYYSDDERDAMGAEARKAVDDNC